MQHIYTLCGETVESSDIMATGTYSYHRALNGGELNFTAILKLCRK
jgi:hypothetical protein